MPGPLAAVPVVWRAALGALALYRLARLVAYEEGPFSLLRRLRAALGGEALGEDGQPRTVLGRGVSCPLCVGVWLAVPVCVMVVYTSPFDWVLLWLGLAGAQAALQTRE